MPKTKKFSILVADDEPDVVEYLSRYLKRNLDCNIFEAKDGREALEVYKNNHLDLILLDLKMPGLNGIDVIREIRKTDHDTLILVITAWDAEKIAHQAIQEGATDLLSKPLSPKAIKLKIETILNRK